MHTKATRNQTVPEDNDCTDLIVIRHGQTQCNLEARGQGHENIPLTSDGISQVVAVGRRLASIDLDALYRSDLGRADGGGYWRAYVLEGSA